MTKIYVGAWDMLHEGPVPRAEWLEAATESQIEAEIARQQSLLPCPPNPEDDDMDSYRKERLVGVFSPEQFCATFNNDLHGAFNTKEYFIRMFKQPTNGKIHVCTIIEQDGKDAFVQATLHAASAQQLSEQVCERVIKLAYEEETTVELNTDSILEACNKGNIGDLLSISITGEEELNHRFLLSTHVIDNVPEKLRDTFKSICNNMRIPWETFGEEQPVFGDLMDFLRDNFGAPKDLTLGYMFLGERASRPDIRWDGLPSFEGFNELLKTVNGILKNNNKRCKLSRAGFSTSDGRPEFELTCTNEEGEITGIHTLNAFECLRYAESIIEEEKGILPF